MLVKKYKEIESSHKTVCRMLEHIQREHSIAKKLVVQLQQETLVFEERINVIIISSLNYCFYCLLNFDVMFFKEYQ